MPGSKVGFGLRFSVLDMSMFSSVGENLITWKSEKQDVFLDLVNIVGI